MSRIFKNQISFMELNTNSALLNLDQLLLIKCVYHQIIKLYMCVWEGANTGVDMQYVQITSLRNYWLKQLEDSKQHKIEVKRNIKIKIGFILYSSTKTIVFIACIYHILYMYNSHGQIMA